MQYNYRKPYFCKDCGLFFYFIKKHSCFALHFACFLQSKKQCKMYICQTCCFVKCKHDGFLTFAQLKYAKISLFYYLKIRNTILYKVNCQLQIIKYYIKTIKTFLRIISILSSKIRASQIYILRVFYRVKNNAKCISAKHSFFS